MTQNQRRQLLDAAERHGIDHLRAFGSLARGEATAESDVDLLVDLTPGRTLLDFREAGEICPCEVETSRGVSAASGEAQAGRTGA